MKNIAKFVSAGAFSVAVAASMVSPAYAWHPQGKITKSVQNVTTNSKAMAADDTSAAVSAKPGDILLYVVEVRNTAPDASKHYNDLAFTVMTDNLPAGIELANNPGNRVVREDLGTILPGKAKTVSYEVRVTAKQDATIENKACFAADSVVRDNPQKGCDSAVVKVTLPEAPTPATEQPVPPAIGQAEPVTSQATPVEKLPNVGVGAAAPVAGLAASLIGYIGYALRLKRRLA